MTMLGPRDSADDGRTRQVNHDLVHELLAAGARSITGSIEVTDKSTKAQARLFLYQGGLYSIDLAGYSPPVFARLRSSGIFSTRTDAELALLARFDMPDPDAVAHAVGTGWVSIDVLANVHQELLLAALGAVLALPKAKVSIRTGPTSSRFCTMPLPGETLVDTIRMRADRLQGTWSMIAPDTEAGESVLRQSPSPVADQGTSAEVAAMAREIDGIRTLDAVAHALGFTRAEAVHVASALIRSGFARVDVEVPPQPVPPQYLVPEAFATHRLVQPVRLPAPVPAPAPPSSAPEAAPARSAVPPVRPVEDDAGDRERERRLKNLRRDIARLQEELQACVRAEQESIDRTAEVSVRLRDARVTLAQLETVEAVPLGVA